MIKVTRIAGESFDFETRQELPKALILSNGVREFSLYVDDDVAQAVLAMMLESEAATEQPKPEPRPAPRRPRPAPSPRPVSETVEIPLEAPAPPPMAMVANDPEAEVEDDNSESDPGEEYNDPATGAESL